MKVINEIESPLFRVIVDHQMGTVQIGAKFSIMITIDRKKSWLMIDDWSIMENAMIEWLMIDQS